MEFEESMDLETKSGNGGEEGAGGGAVTKEDVKTVMSAFEEFKRVNDARLAEQKERADRLETVLKRTGAPLPTPTGLSAGEKAFGTFLRKGEATLSDVERKALDEVQVEYKSLNVSISTQGGYLAPPQFASEILKNIVEFSPIRQVARVGSMSAPEIITPRRTGKPTAHWVNETEDRSETQAAYGQVTIPANEMTAFVDVSTKLLDDAAFNINAEIASDLAEEFGRLEGEAFVTGDAVKKPEGILANTSVPQIASGHATQVTADSLIDALYSLPAFYRSQSTWLMNGTTLALLRKLKDGQGQYLWQPGIAAGQPETILGRPVVEAVDMPGIGAGLTPIVVGAFMQGYRIYDRTGFEILRDPFTMATKGLVRFHARRRVGAGVVKPEAIRKMVVAASL